ncbi:histidine kinase [Chitinophaga sp. Cy-1792]|uniref:histidine kinase n=1 Tax=Chitinophaga sp. Cy-1792 TaxID=2608339 RepID=UPI00141F9293|nr:histidine kinase [Chitinophaga sp. Cy-1792]NIG55531.1 histidine kinase [Chitinophaga sp. Cy-1792]
MNYHREPYRYLIHGAIWMSLVLLYCYPQLRAGWRTTFSMEYTVVRYILYGFINFNLFYLLVFGLLTKPIQQRQYIRTIAYALAAVIAWCFLKYFIGSTWFKDLVIQKAMALIGRPKSYFTFAEYFKQAFKTGLGVALLAIGYGLFLNRRNTELAEQGLESAVSTASIRFERMHRGSQLLLQHLQALTPILEEEATRSEEGVRAILLLSELLRYMLYDKEITEAKVDLKKELYFFQHYITLRKYLYPHQQLDLEISSGNESATLIEPLQMQAATEERLQQLSGFTGNIRITVSIKMSQANLEIRPVKESMVAYSFHTKLYHEQV